MAGRKKVLLKVGFLNFKPRCIHKKIMKSTTQSADHKLHTGDHFGRQWGGKDVADEPVREQKVQQPVQGHHRG